MPNHVYFHIFSTEDPKYRPKRPPLFWKPSFKAVFTHTYYIFNFLSIFLHTKSENLSQINIIFSGLSSRPYLHITYKIYKIMSKQVTFKKGILQNAAKFQDPRQINHFYFTCIKKVQFSGFSSQPFTHNFKNKNLCVNRFLKINK